MTASLRSPRIVANSARRRCWGGGAEEEGRPPLMLFARPSPDAGPGLCVGAGEGDGEPKRRRVEENRRDGSRRLEENW